MGEIVARFWQASGLTFFLMDDCPFDANTKIEPVEGTCWWFADVPEAGITEDTYLSGYVSFSFASLAAGEFPETAILTPTFLS